MKRINNSNYRIENVDFMRHLSENNTSCITFFCIYLDDDDVV